ncbi:hypothetical protein OQ519_00380 [Pseudomonas lurida]|uniref:DUF6602 domain-containing protein n=1 Tax=Pseudomonas lurida TaxID=244566 RepID=UPI001A7ED1BF|nr:DUF6602 domain-containing protein [Pseudomonas lurida]UZQ74824.1 hypothetical protein OQ519_00380 [Pseudomonas lurida]
MRMKKGDLCFVSSDPWESLMHYRFVEYDEQGGRVIATVRQPRSRRILSSSEDLRLHPFSIRASIESPPNQELYSFILDLTSSLAGQNNKVSLADAVDRICSDKRVTVSKEHVEFVLKAFVTEGLINVIVGKGTAGKVMFLELGKYQQEMERRRAFAASMASELETLSERIGLLVSHGPTVGAYREQLLINMLRKHLPKRYHIASGFIYGCPRQFDVLIYDCIEYAPLFREDDLVVIPANAVRAVIEVKTTLSATELRKSLDILYQVGRHDDGYPPIFKGVFSFKSPMSEKSICSNIHDYYMNGYMGRSELYGLVNKPYAHITCACIYGKSYVFSSYRKTKLNEYIPALYTKKSNTGLKSQVAWFMQELLAHLRYDAAKNNYFSYIDDMLGSDTLVQRHQDIADPEWGPYAAVVDSDLDDSEVEAYLRNQEQRITNIQSWLAGTEDSWRKG